MQKWEYTVMGYDISEETLNELGSEGWELIAVVSDDIRKHEAVHL